MKYAILYHPGHNRVYFDTSKRLAIPEFLIVTQDFTQKISDLQQEMIAGIEYLTFHIENPLTDNEIQTLSSLSYAYALYRLCYINDELLLLPVARTNPLFLDEGISGILKYSGKTNEIFTRMLINIAYASQANRTDIRLLDPIAGKGTTLFEGLIRGFDVYGVEIGEKVVAEAVTFTKKYLENARYKFTCHSLKCSGPNKSYTAQRHSFSIAANKEDRKNKLSKTCEFIAGNTTHADKYYAKDFFDLIVGDLPYGVQHGNVTNEKQSSLTRNPAELLRVCLPIWKTVLKPGGVIALSWNRNVVARHIIEQIMTDAGFSVKQEEAYIMDHRVDQSIWRDVIVANKET